MGSMREKINGRPRSRSKRPSYTPELGKVVPTRSVRPLNPSKIHSEVEIKKRKVFDELIERRHRTSINPPKPMKGEFDTKEPDDADGFQAATDVTIKERRQRNVPMGCEGQWKGCS
jgi:hypothetical protein